MAIIEGNEDFVWEGDGYRCNVCGFFHHVRNYETVPVVCEVEDEHGGIQELTNEDVGV